MVNQLYILQLSLLANKYASYTFTDFFGSREQFYSDISSLIQASNSAPAVVNQINHDISALTVTSADGAKYQPISGNAYTTNLITLSIFPTLKSTPCGFTFMALNTKARMFLM